MANPSKDTVLMLVVFVIGALLNYAYNIAMVWLLLPDQYGILGVAISFLTILSLFVSSAFPVTVAKFLSEDNENSVKHRVFKSSLLGNLCIALIISFIFYALYVLGIIHLGSTYRPFVLLIILGTVFSSIGTVYASALRGMFRFKEFGFINVISILAKLIFAILLVSVGFGALGAFSGLIIATIAGLLLAIIFSSDLRFWKTPGWADKKIYSFTLPIFFGSFFMTLLMNLDILGVKFLSENVLSDTLTGYYRSALILAEFPVFAVGALMGAMFPYISKYSSNGNNYSNMTLKYVVLIICPVSIALFAIPSSMIALVFPPAYASAADALGLLALGMGFFVIITALSGIFQAIHRPKVPAIILTLAIIVDVICLFFLVPRYGILGAAASTTIACTIGLLGLAGAYFKYGFIKLDLIEGLKIIISSIIFGSLVFIIPHQTKFLTLVDLFFSSIIYMLVLFLFRLLKDKDIKHILSGFSFSIKKKA